METNDIENPQYWIDAEREHVKAWTQQANEPQPDNWDDNRGMWERAGVRCINREDLPVVGKDGLEHGVAEAKQEWEDALAEKRVLEQEMFDLEYQFETVLYFTGDCRPSLFTLGRGHDAIKEVWKMIRSAEFKHNREQLLLIMIEYKNKYDEHQKVWDLLNRTYERYTTKEYEELCRERSLSQQVASECGPNVTAGSHEDWSL